MIKNEIHLNQPSLSFLTWTSTFASVTWFMKVRLCGSESTYLVTCFFNNPLTLNRYKQSNFWFDLWKKKVFNQLTKKWISWYIFIIIVIHDCFCDDCYSIYHIKINFSSFIKYYRRKSNINLVVNKKKIRKSCLTY